MPSSAASLPARKAARRRAVEVLRVTASVCAYSAERIGNGLGPEQARAALMEAVAELEQTAVQLRRLALGQLTLAERRALAGQLAADGLSQRRIASQLGVSRSTVQTYLRSQAPAGRGR